MAAAREVFAEDGIRAPLSAVARRAGVGQGSLYRHFPDRLSLAVAVFDENIVDLEALTGEGEHSLDELFVSIADQAMASAGLIEIMAEHQRDERALALSGRVRGVVAALLDRDREAGRVGRGVSVDDVLIAISMLAFAVAQSVPEDRSAVAALARRMFHAAFRSMVDSDR